MNNKYLLRTLSTGPDLRRSTLPRRRVVIVQTFVPHYRISFFERIRARFDAEGIDFELIHGRPSGADATKLDSRQIAWARPIQNRSLSFRSKELTWQPCLKSIWDADLVIVEQASHLILNYALFAGRPFGGPKVALWGHGRNLKGHAVSRIGEKMKSAISRRPDWWFAYNNLSADIVRELGFPSDRITVVQNAIDTTSLREARSRLTEATVHGLRDRLHLTGNKVGIFAGGLYTEKRLDFLIAAARAIRSRIPDFELIVLGSGSEEAVVAEAAETESWIHWVGPVFDEERIPYFALADVMLMPGLVGLAVTDSFALEVPMVTVDLPFHSPEIDYLIDGENGIKLPLGTGTTAYAQAVSDLLSDDGRMQRLRSGCRSAAQRYTIEEMVDRFAEGVRLALG